MSSLPNPARGEVVLLIDDTAHHLCLTLGALARIEAALGAQDLGALETRLRHLSPRDLLTVVSALLEDPGMTPERLALARVHPVAAAKAVADAFALAFA